MTKWVKVEYGEGTIEALAEIGIDAKKEVNRALAKDRIQQLVKLATHVEEPDGLFPREVFDEEKFAELIVRECAQIAKTAEPWKSDDLILKYFGIKDENT